MSYKYKITICIPTFKRVSDLEKCFESIRSQHREGLQVCISDNASPDGTSHYLGSLNYPWVRVRINESNVGPMLNLNGLLEMSEGQYCFILTDDDRLAPGAIEQLFKCLREGTLGVLLSHIWSYAEGSIVPSKKREWYSTERIFPPSVEAAELLGEHTWAWSRLCFRRDLINFDLLEQHCKNGYHLTYALMEMFRRAHTVYVPFAFVEHTVGNTVHWDLFGPDRPSIALKLDLDLAEALSFGCSRIKFDECISTAIRSFASRHDGFALAVKFGNAELAYGAMRQRLQKVGYDRQVPIIYLYTLMMKGKLTRLIRRLLRR